MNLEYAYGDELFDMGLVNDDPWSLANKVGITILSDKDLFISVVDLDENRVIAALFNAYQNDEYSFDVVVDPNYQGQGIGTELIDIAMQDFRAMPEDAILKLDVVNKGLIPFLEKVYSLRVMDKDGSHYIMMED